VLLSFVSVNSGAFPAQQAGDEQLLSSVVLAGRDIFGRYPCLSSSCGDAQRLFARGGNVIQRM